MEKRKIHKESLINGETGINTIISVTRNHRARNKNNANRKNDDDTRGTNATIKISTARRSCASLAVFHTSSGKSFFFISSAPLAYAGIGDFDMVGTNRARVLNEMTTTPTTSAPAHFHVNFLLISVGTPLCNRYAFRKLLFRLAYFFYLII